MAPIVRRCETWKDVALLWGPPGGHPPHDCRRQWMKEYRPARKRVSATVVSRLGSADGIGGLIR